MKFEVAPSTSKFETGPRMDVEKQSFTWSIENFQTVRRDPLKMPKTQRIVFSAGSSLGRPSKWVVYLEEDVEKRDLWIYLNVQEPSASDRTWKNASAQLTFSMRMGYDIIWDGGIKAFLQLKFDLRKITVEKLTRSKQGWGQRYWIGRREVGAPTGKTLVINLAFQLYAPSKPAQPCRTMTRDWKDLELMMKDPNCSQEVKVISMDKKEFTVQKRILEVRASKLKAILERTMAETKSGVIHLSDISSRVLQIILTFLKTGEIHPDWSETDTEGVVELTNAASKYQLPELLQFLDGALGKVCKVENVLKLFTLAHQLSLKTAEEELSKYIYAHSISPKNCCKMFEGITVPGLDGSVHSLPKRKSRFWTFLSSPFKGLFAKN